MNPLDIIRKHYDTTSNLYEILVKHSEDVASKALQVVYAHPELDANPDFIYEAAMLHDIGIKFTNASKIDCYGEHKYIMHGYLGAELLRNEGYPMHARVAERHTGTGLYPKNIEDRGINLPNGIYYPETIEEKIITYADKFFSKTKLYSMKSVEDIEKSLSKHGDDSVIRFREWHKIFK